MDMQTDKTNNMTIKGRLLLGFSLLGIIVAFATVITLYSVNSTKDYINSVLKTELPAFSTLMNLGIQSANASSSLKTFIYTNDPTALNEVKIDLNNIRALHKSIDNYSTKWMDLSISNEWKVLSNNLDKLYILADTISKKNYLQNDPKEKNDDITQLNSIYTAIIASLDGSLNFEGKRTGGIYDMQYNIISNNSNVILEDMKNIEITVISLLVVFILSTVVICILTINSIKKHINLYRQFSSKIASRDLRHSLNIATDDEIGLLGTDLNKMAESLSDITKEIIVASQNMVTTLEEVKQSVNMQSSGATQQASSINEITASLDEIEKSSSQTMEKAKTLGAAAERTREKGQMGLDAVEQSIQGMKMVKDKVQLIALTILELSQKTQQVGEITMVVNSLAQQSKMLALNASIEAAKAGEAGKGFAVVASEVKNLAEQSEQSTSQVQKILEDIRQATEKAVMVTEEGTKGVDHGTGLVEETGEIVRNLSDVIHETTLASQQIEAAVRQESVGIEQIATGMNEINQVTSSFVSSTQQTTEAITNLSNIAKKLKEQVDSYVL